MIIYINGSDLEGLTKATSFFKIKEVTVLVVGSSEVIPGSHLGTSKHGRSKRCSNEVPRHVFSLSIVFSWEAVEIIYFELSDSSIWLKFQFTPLMKPFKSCSQWLKSIKNVYNWRPTLEFARKRGPKPEISLSTVWESKHLKFYNHNFILRGRLVKFLLFILFTSTMFSECK